MKSDIFQSCGYCWVFQICWHIEYSTFTASSFRIWNSSTGIPSPPLALFVVMLPKTRLTSHSRMSGSRWVITPLWLSGSWRSFLYSQFFCKSVQSCPTLCDPVDNSPTVSSVHRILQTRIVEWVAMSSSRGSTRPRDGTHVSYVSCISRQVLYHWHHQAKRFTHQQSHSHTYNKAQSCIRL